LRATREGKDWIFVSDAHFSGRKPGEMDSFIRFMVGEHERMDRLVILGDFFEFFFGFRGGVTTASFPFKEYLPVLECLRTLYREGIRLTYFEGNHDFSLGSFFREHLGIEVEVHPEGSEEMLGGKKAFVAHGDLSNPNQWTYRLLRRLLKNRFSYGLMNLAGPRLARAVARKLSEMSYERSHREGSDGPPPAFKQFAYRRFREGYGVVILGHSHYPDEAEETIEGKRCLYFNVGDWETHRSFLRYTPPDRFLLGRFEAEDRC